MRPPARRWSRRHFTEVDANVQDENVGEEQHPSERPACGGLESAEVEAGEGRRSRAALGPSDVDGRVGALVGPARSTKSVKSDTLPRGPSAEASSVPRSKPVKAARVDRADVDVEQAVVGVEESGPEEPRVRGGACQPSPASLVPPCGGVQAGRPQLARAPHPHFM